MNVQSKITGKGISISFNDRVYALEYPQDVWSSYPDTMKKCLLDNWSFLKILPAAMMHNQNQVTMNTSYPRFQAAFCRMMLAHLPATAEKDNQKTQDLIRNFMNLTFEFNDMHENPASYGQELSEKAIINFTFGKESLLTYALCKELEMPSSLVYVEEPDMPLEIEYKKQAKQKFFKEFQTSVTSLVNETALLRNAKHFNLRQSIIGDGQIITEYCLAMLPFSHYHQAKYIMFGNENSCSMSYTNKDGFLTYPVFDQTDTWMMEMNNMVKQLTNNKGKVVSIVSPIHELSIIKILHTRYKEIGKYQMSCFPDENEHGKENHWCHHCSKCARVYMLLLANNISPKRVGFTENMLSKEYEDIFSLFGKSAVMTGWDRNCGRDEQLYSFYLAYKNGAKGYLIDKFKESYLDEAKEKEEEFHKKFYSAHDNGMIPKELKTRLFNIYKEELT